MLDDKDITPQQGMLVLERDKFEIINIGDDIQIKILDIRQSKVSIGILAPKEVKVHRNEVYKRILKNQGEAKDGGSQ